MSLNIGDFIRVQNDVRKIVQSSTCKTFNSDLCDLLTASVEDGGYGVPATNLHGPNGIVDSSRALQYFYNLDSTRRQFGQTHLERYLPRFRKAVVAQLQLSYGVVAKQVLRILDQPHVARFFQSDDQLTTTLSSYGTIPNTQQPMDTYTEMFRTHPEESLQTKKKDNSPFDWTQDRAWVQYLIGQATSRSAKSESSWKTKMRHIEEDIMKQEVFKRCIGMLNFEDNKKNTPEGMIDELDKNSVLVLLVQWLCLKEQNRLRFKNSDAQLIGRSFVNQMFQMNDLSKLTCHNRDSLASMINSVFDLKEALIKEIEELDAEAEEPFVDDPMDYHRNSKLIIRFFDDDDAGDTVLFRSRFMKIFHEFAPKEVIKTHPIFFSDYESLLREYNRQKAREIKVIEEESSSEEDEEEDYSYLKDFSKVVTKSKKNREMIAKRFEEEEITLDVLPELTEEKLRMFLDKNKKPIFSIGLITKILENKNYDPTKKRRR